jgi:hypothetical protein
MFDAFKEVNISEVMQVYDVSTLPSQSTVSLFPLQ